MANQVPGVREKLIEAAKEEFMQKGYYEASLRDIAKAAETSTNSIYVRFSDKAGLFAAIVNPARERIEQFYRESLSDFSKDHGNAGFSEMEKFTSSRLEEMVDILYDDYTAYKLLVCCSEETEFSDWVGMLADLESQATLQYIENNGSDVLSSGRLTLELLHMVSSAYWSGIFEALRHDMKREDVKDYVVKVERFFTCGWQDIFETR